MLTPLPLNEAMQKTQKQQQQKIGKTNKQYLSNFLTHKNPRIEYFQCAKELSIMILIT